MANKWSIAYAIDRRRQRFRGDAALSYLDVAMVRDCEALIAAYL
ncbi:MAG: hypothetical protein R2839_00485 [Thermomicrobiales bacterium]